MLNDSGYVFEQVLPRDLEEIARIHREFFGCDLSGQLGVDFLKDYYQEIKTTADGIVVVCKDKGRVVGFISGLSSKNNFLVKVAAANLGSILIQVIVHPISFLRFIKRTIVLKEGEFKSELMSLAILEEYRGRDIASELLSRLEEFFKAKNVKNYKVFTEVKYQAGCRFYEKSGFKLHQQTDLFGIQARLYSKTIKT